MTDNTTIFKYALKLEDLQTLLLPQGAEPLSAQLIPKHLVMDNLDADLWVWVKHDTDKPKQKVDFVIIGTGNPMPTNIDTYTFLSTLRMDFPHTSLFFHLFYSKES